MRMDHNPLSQMGYKNIKIIVKQGDITQEKVDAIVNPANSLGFMGGGVAGALKKIGGEIIEKEAIAKSPIPIGKAITTTAGKLSAKIIIHAPTMERPAQLTSIKNVKKAVLAALKCADENKIESITFPGMGTGVGGLPKSDAARVMIWTIKDFIDQDKPKYLGKIILIGFDSELTDTFKKNCERIFR
ncbi:MAG: macro domain-containing protein [Euryarchaeota archaeon]|nr:macro domain-containing protein [Euryarchaeota archaeon]